MDYKKATRNIRQELKNYIVENNLKSLVMGISGGIDSALCAALAKPICDELNIPLIGRSLPTRTNAGDENSRAQEIGKSFCTDFEETNIQDGFTAMYNLAIQNFSRSGDDGSTKNNILKGNIKARIRMILLYDVAGASNGMVLSTDNYTEYLLGFSTIMGDWGDFGMIQYLWKTEVYNMSQWLCDNELNGDNMKSLYNCINCQATDGLGISSSDLEQILPEWVGTSIDGYKKVDDILLDYINNEIGDNSNPVIKRHNNTHFKRNWPITIKRNDILVSGQ